jgi:hypothetical protein
MGTGSYHDCDKWLVRMASEVHIRAKSRKLNEMDVSVCRSLENEHVTPITRPQHGWRLSRAQGSQGNYCTLALIPRAW